MFEAAPRLVVAVVAKKATVAKKAVREEGQVGEREDVETSVVSSKRQRGSCCLLSERKLAVELDKFGKKQCKRTKKLASESLCDG